MGGEYFLDVVRLIFAHTAHNMNKVWHIEIAHSPFVFFASLSDVVDKLDSLDMLVSLKE